MTHKNQGFTLIELMIVLVIAAILLTVALPAYQNYIRRGHAQTAAADLVALSLAMENLYQRQLQYPLPSANPTTSTSATISYVASGGATQPWQPARAAIFNYTLNVASTSYSLTASAITGSNLAGCSLTLSSGNTRTISGGDACGGLTTW